jgi:dihydroorotate dehydrogenase (fumarate)
MSVPPFSGPDVGLANQKARDVMDLSTTYLGFELPHPLMPGASPLVDDLDIVRRLEDAGAAAIVMHSLFEEQLLEEQTINYLLDLHEQSYGEAESYLPGRRGFDFGASHDLLLGPDQYLNQVRRIKEAVAVPVIASLNGATPGGWTDYARLIEQAGADALELNVYFVATDPLETAHAVESRIVEIVSSVRHIVTIPVAVKLSPFFTALPGLANRLAAAGADGLILFNRFYQPDLDLDRLEAAPRLRLSDSSELLLRLRWLAILAGRVNASLAVSGGVHTSTDALKAVMAGADAVQVVSALLQHGPEYLRTIRDGMTTWLEEHEYDSLRQLQRSMSLERCPDPQAFERGNYVRILQSWRPAGLWPGGSMDYPV